MITLRTFLRKQTMLTEADATSISVPESLLKDMDVVKDHMNKILLKAYGCKIEAFTYSAAGDNVIDFKGTPFAGRSLGIFGSVTTECNVIVSVDIDGTSAESNVKLVWLYKNGEKGHSPIGKYRFNEGKISYYSLDESGNIVEDSKEEIGESVFAVSNGAVDIGAGDTDIPDGTEKKNLEFEL